MLEKGVIGKKLRVVPMWFVHDKGNNIDLLYHHSDEQRAKEMGKAEYTWVGVPEDYFVGTVQPAEWFSDHIYKIEDLAYQEVDKHNEGLS